MTDKKTAGWKRISEAAKSALHSVKSSLGFDLTARFSCDAGPIELPVDMEGDTIWATQNQIADLFGVKQPDIAKHIKNVYAEGEADKEATHSKMELVQFEGGREVKRATSHYNLDVILAVGYRVSGKKATEFRKWANRVLKGYIEDGYALNGQRLNSDPAALMKLAQEVRTIRTSEMNLYAQVREIFATMAIDYDPKSSESRRFFATCQDIFHYAASEKTASEIISERADATLPNMGLTALGNRQPRSEDVTVAKNYCTPTEIKKMELVGEAFLIYAESLAVQEKQISMARLATRLTAMVDFYEYPVFPGYTYSRPTAPQAKKYAKKQYEMFKRDGRSALPPAA